MVNDVLPPWYYYFFGVAEPASALAGAVYACFRSETYALDLVPTGVERFTQIIGNTIRGKMLITQLGSCFFVLSMASFFLFPAFVKCAPQQQETLVRSLLIPLLLGDFTHIIFTLAALPTDIARDPMKWTQLIHGNVTITLVLVAVRVLWLTGVARFSPSAGSVSDPRARNSTRQRKSDKAE